MPDCKRIRHLLGGGNVGLVQQSVGDMLLDVQIPPLISRSQNLE